MVKYKIEHDRENCISCAACWTTCSKFWKQGEDGKATLKGNKNNSLEIEEKDFQCNMDAANACPVNIIHITNLDKGKKLK